MPPAATEPVSISRILLVLATVLSALVLPFDPSSTVPASEPAVFDADTFTGATSGFPELREGEPTGRQVDYTTTLQPPPILGDLDFSTSGRERAPNAESYPHIYSTDVWNPNRLFYTDRATILQMNVNPKFDPMKLINTDRPDFTDVATVVGKGVTQFETGYTWDRRKDQEIRRERQTAPSALVRIGVSDKFEWRARWNGWIGQDSTDRNTGGQQWQTGYQDLELGFKYILVDQDDWVPLQSIVTRLDVPLGSRQFSGNAVDVGLTYIYNWQVRRWWFFRGATGFDYLREAGIAPTGFGLGPAQVFAVSRDSFYQGHQAISSYLQWSERFGQYTEWFCFYRSGAADNRPDHYHNYGLYFYVTPNFQLDARIGWRIGSRVDETFTGAGISWRY